MVYFFQTYIMIKTKSNIGSNATISPAKKNFTVKERALLKGISTSFTTTSAVFLDTGFASPVC